MADNLTTATIDVRANTRGLEKDILKALKTVEFSEINTKKSSQALGRITGQVSEFNKSLEASNARVIAFGASAGAIFAVEKAFSSLISSTIQVEKKLTDINVLLGLSASSLQKFGDSLFGVARNTAQSFSDVADAATELARQGLGIEETLKRTNAALILTRLSGLDAKSSVEALTATLNSFSGSALDAVEVVNKLANVDAAFAVSSADLANAISRVGSTAVDAGVSLDELIALVTSAQQTTARGGAVIGNSFKTIFTRLQRGKVQDLLESLGVDTADGQSAISMLQQLAATYDTLGAAQKSYVAEQVGGVFQINILKAALSDLGKEYSIYGRALDTSLSSTDQAIRRNELLNKTVSALSTQAYANLEQAANKIGSLVFEPNAKGFLSGFNDLLSSFNDIDMESAGGKLMAGFFKGIGDFIGGPGAVLATAVLVKLFSRLTQFAAGSAKELLGTNKAAQQQAAIEQSILSILQKNSQFTSQILSGKMTTVQAEKELLNYLTAQSNILREQERLSKVIGSNLRAAGVSIGASGVPMVGAAKGKKAASAGYVPNFAADQAIGQALENAGAKEHGYRAGKAKKTTIHDGNGKSFKSFVNSKEYVKTFTNAAGKKATIVRPPNGFGKNTEYAASGFIPSFAKNAESIRRGVDFEKRLNKALKGSASFSPNAPMDFPLPTGYGSDYEARRAIGISDASVYGDAKLTRSRKSEQSLLDKYLRTSEGSKDFRSARETDKGFLNLKPKGLSMLFSGAGSDSRGISYISTVNTQLSSGAKKLIESRFGKKDKKSRTLAMPYIADKINEQALSSFSSGFIPNFGKMQDFYKNLKEKEGAGDVFNKRAKQVNAATKKGAEVKDLGSLPYTMIHAGSGGNFQSSASYLKKDKKTNKETRYLAKIWTAGLDQSKLGGANVQKRVGDALVTEANNLSRIFNPSGGSQFSNYNQLSNTGSVFSAAGTVFESAIRSAFNVSAQGQSDRIDFPSPSSQLRSFFNNAPGSYEAKIENNDNNRSSALAKYIAINSLAKGYVPNFKKIKSKFGTATLGKTDKIDLELFSKTLGKKINPESIASIEDLTANKPGAGAGLYSDIASSINGKQGLFGYALAQDRKVSGDKKKDPLAKLKAKYPQIIRRIGLGGETYISGDYGRNVVSVKSLKDLEKNQDSILRMSDPAILTLKAFSGGFIPNFLDVSKGGLPFGVRGRTNYGSAGSKTNIQLGVGAESGTLAHELFHSAYSRSTFKKAEANPNIGKFLSSPGKYAGSGFLIGDKIFKNLNKNNLIKSLGLNPIQLDFDGKNPNATYSGSRAVDEITTRIQEKVFRNKGDLSKLSADENAFVKNLEEQGIISKKRLSNVSRRSQEGSKFRNLVEGKFSSVMGGANSGFVPNFASSSLINEINKRILNPNIAQKLKEGQGLKDEAYIKAASKLGVNVSGLENLMAGIGFPLKGKDSVKKVSSALGFGFGRSFAIDALKMGDWDYVKSSFEKNGLTKSDFDKLSQFAKTPKGETAFRWGFKSKAGGFIPNFANIFSSTRDVRKKANANQSSLNTFRVVHPLNPKIDAQGRVSFPDLEKKAKGSVKIIHNEGMEGQNVFTLPSFLDFVNSRGNKETFFRRNSFDYVLSSAGYIPNFADALNDAINRERAAGLSKSQIYVDQHSSLKNKNNPMGLMVANTRDEPKGGTQGIKRAKKEGRNPKTYGAASGFVPNFATKVPGPPIPDPAGLASKNSIDKIQKILASFESQAAGTYGKEEFTKAWSDALDIALAKASSGAESVGKRVSSSAVTSPASSGGRNGPLANDAELNAAANEAAKAVIVADKKKAQVVNKSIETENKSIEANNKLIQAVEKDVQAVSASTAAKSKGGKLNKVKDFVGRNSMSLGFGLQTAAGMVGEFAGNDDTKSGRVTKAVAGGAGDIASFAGTGAMIAGPYGAAAGAAVGLTKAIIDITKAYNSKLPDLEKALQTSSDSMNRFSESGQKLLQLNEQYADALTSGGDPGKAADIMAKTQEAYAEELSKLTDSQRASMISAIAQGKGQEEYAKILKQLSDKVRGDEGATALAKFREDDSESLRGLTGGLMGQGDKKMLKGLDSDFAKMFSKNLDDAEIRSAIDIYSSKGPGKDTEYGKEQSALAVLAKLASSEKNSQDEKDSFDNILNEFKQTTAETDSSEFADGILKALEKAMKDRADAKQNVEAVKKDTENRKKKEQQELALREAANARLLKIQAETESVFRKFNDSLDDFIGALEAGSKMRGAAGDFRADYLDQSGANSYIVDKQREKNLVSSNQDDLAIADLKNRQDSFNQFNAAINDMLSGITAESAKLGVMQTEKDQQNKLIDTKLSLQSQLSGASAQVFAGDTEGAKATIDEVFKNLNPEQRAQIDASAIVKGIQDLKNVADQSNKNSRDLVANSRRDLGIQAQQLIFQKATSKLNQAQNYGGSGIKEIIKDDPENAFNRAISALNDAKILGYNQKDLKQGKEDAVNGAWKGKEKTTWGINGEKPNPAMSGAIIDFYKAAGEIGGESVISTDSKDFGALTQAVSEQIRKKLEELKQVGDGVVDPAVFTRMESTLQGLGGEDKVAQLKTMKELGFANIGGKKIMDEAMSGYTGGAFEGLDPALKKAFESTSDEGAGASILLLAGQQKQTDSLLGGMRDVTANATLETNSLLSQQPQAIADALSTILEKGRKQNEKDNLDSDSANLGSQIEDLGAQIGQAESKKTEAQGVIDSLGGKISAWQEKSGYDGKKNNDVKMLEDNSPELQEAKKIVKQSKSQFMNQQGGVTGGFKYDAAKELIAMSEDFKKLKAAKDEVVKSDSSIESLQEKKSKAESDKSTIDKQTANLGDQIKNLGSAVVPSVTSSSSGLSPISEMSASVRKGVEDAVGSGKGKESFGVGSSTEKQLDAIKKSSSNYKITSRDGVKRTIEKDAMYEAGVSPVNQKNLDKETRLNRLNKAFQDIDKRNALPSYDNFKDVYSNLGGGEKEGRQMYESKWAEKFGGSMPMDEAVKKGVQDATGKTSSSGKAVEKKPALSFVDWAKKEGKISQGFQLTEGMKTGQEALPDDVAKARKEFLSLSRTQVKNDGTAVQGKADKALVAGQADAVKRGVEEAASKSTLKGKSSEKKPGLSFVDWAKKEGKIPQDFKLTKEMSTGQQALPESVAKARKEFLSSFGAQTKNGGAIASTTEDKGKLVSAVKQTEADEANRKMFAEQDAAIEAMKPTWTGSKMVPDGKGGFKNVAAPKQGEESLRQAEYETAKRNAAFEKSRFASRQSAGGVSETEAAIQGAPKVPAPTSQTNNSPVQNEVPKIVENITSSMNRKIVPEEDKSTSPEQDPSQQILNSILASVNQIAQQITSNQEGGQQPAQAGVGASAGSQPSSSGGSGAGGVSVSTPVSVTVNASAGQGTDAATAIAEQIKAGLSSFLSSPEFIGKVTSIANQAAGNKVPPTVPPK
jgi:TP901 family phage tail tape measure protein